MTKHKKSQDTWLNILDAAENLFAQHGYEGASTRKIANQAGISINTLHYHCGGKKNLYKKVMERALVSVTNLVDEHVSKILKNDLTDTNMLEDSITELINDLFDTLHKNPNYARLFFRQLLVTDLDLRSMEWDTLIPTLRTWSRQIESQIDEERLGGINLFLFFLSASLIYWGLFVQPTYIANYFSVAPDSEQLLDILKDHAREMTLRMITQRSS